MARSTEGLVGRGVLIIGHAAGMLDLVSMPLWVGVLVEYRHLSPAQAGLLITTYMAGVFVTSLALAPRFYRLPSRLIAIAGFIIGCLAFLAITRIDGFAALIPAHLMAGVGAGSGLSMVHGTISRSMRPHRLFAIANFGVAIFSIVFFISVPGLLQQNPDILFYVLSGLLVIGAIAAAAAFPTPPARAPVETGAIAAGEFGVPIRLAVILAFAGVTLQSAGQGEIYAFLERIGAWRGFSAADIGRILAISGLVNLMAPIVAALLENVVPRLAAICVGLLVHASIAVTASSSPVFAIYAIAGSMLVFMSIFNHTFMFGVISKLDPSGNAASSTPAMLMLGAAIGPALGGLIAQFIGFGAIGWCAAAFLLASALCFVAIGWLRMPALKPGTT
jgi:predicted MFS family arabinose efflux permease